jgi:hypothetical protein
MTEKKDHVGASRLSGGRGVLSKGRAKVDRMLKKSQVRDLEPVDPMDLGAEFAWADRRGVEALAREHTSAAVLVLAEIMQSPEAKDEARIASAKALIEIGWGKARTVSAEEKDRRGGITINVVRHSDPEAEQMIRTLNERSMPVPKVVNAITGFEEEL